MLYCTCVTLWSAGVCAQATRLAVRRDAVHCCPCPLPARAALSSSCRCPFAAPLPPLLFRPLFPVARPTAMSETDGQCSSDARHTGRNKDDSSEMQQLTRTPSLLTGHCAALTQPRTPVHPSPREAADSLDRCSISIRTRRNRRNTTVSETTGHLRTEEREERETHGTQRTEGH